MSRRAVPFVGQHCDTPASPPSDVAQGTGEAAQGGLRRFPPALDNRVGSMVGLLANRPCPGDPFGGCDAGVELARSLSNAEELPAVGSSCLGLDPCLAKSAEGRHGRIVGPGVGAPGLNGQRTDGQRRVAGWRTRPAGQCAQERSGVQGGVRGGPLSIPPGSAHSRCQSAPQGQSVSASYTRAPCRVIIAGRI
jgi:hypothetical protein